MVFYRKYRPQRFKDLIGQEHIVQTLTNSLETDCFSHGYLFAGPKGSGKTTLARIFAKALNCSGRVLGKQSFEPCNRCLSCKEITGGKSLDMIEIDAASNRGIDEIRDLREKIRFAPTNSPFKVYIIDEVHMLTKEAFNALLKTLEEPPGHVVFIMATTEPQKVLPTILSRVQRFDFHRAIIEEITKLLEKIVIKESIKIDKEAIQLIGQLSFGSYRDGLSLLEQVTSVRKTLASRISLEDVQVLLGISGEKSVFDFVELLAKKDRKKSFEFISRLYLQGVDLENFTIKVVEVLRKIALLKLGEENLLDLTKEQREQVKNLANDFEIEVLMKMIEKFSDASYKIKSAVLPQLPIEMIVYEFTAPAKIEEQSVNGLQTTEIIENKKSEENSKKSVINDTKSEVRSPKSESKLSKDLWIKIIKEAKAHNNHIAALLRDAVLADTSNNTITLAFKFKFHANMVSGKKNTQIIESIIEKITGSRYILKCIVDPELVIKAPVDPEEELLNGAKEVFDLS